MKVAVFSDTHLGYRPRHREQDAFENALQAIKLCVAQQPDIILFCGDMFDKAEPEHEDFLEAFKILREARKAPTPKLRITIVSKDVEEHYAHTGIPVIAIHGTHEFRSNKYKNAMHVLDNAGFLRYLHVQTAIIEKDGERVAVCGIGGVPEREAADFLRYVAPKPVENAFNILLLHQSIVELLPVKDEMVATVSFSSLPEGFDYIINGHLHWHNFLSQQGKRLLIPGSTVITQQKKLEAEKPKCICIIDTTSGSHTFHAIPGQRPFYYKKIELKDASVEDIAKAMEQVLKDINTHAAKKPLVKVKLTGTLHKGLTNSDLRSEEFAERYAERVILSIDCDFEEQAFKRRIKELSAAHLKRKSLAELGLDFLEKNLEETKFAKTFDAHLMFKTLAEQKSEEAIDMLLELAEKKSKEGKQPTPTMEDEKQNAETNKKGGTLADYM